MKNEIMTTTLDIASLAEAIFYPVALVIIFLLFRREIPSIARGIAGRLTKIGFSGISLELAKAESFDPNWKKDGTLDLRQNAASLHVDDSTAGNFLSQLRVGGNADYAIVNLGNGGEWLTSRLYIMSIIFERMKGVSGFVFLETTTNTRKKFVGWAKPDKIRWALSQRYHWLETAFAEAYYSTLILPNVNTVSDYGRLGYTYDIDSPNPGIDLLQNFLERIQAPSGNIPVAGEEDNWITLSSNDNTQEHAKWLNAELLEDILGDALVTKCIKPDDQDARTIEHKINEYLVQAHSFIAVVNESSRFEYLLKREKLLEQILIKKA